MCKSILLCFSFIYTFQYCNTQNINIGNLAEIFNALSGGDECIFKCPKGNKPEKDLQHQPSSNGCGSYGLTINTSKYPGFKECCNEHDKCYDTCNEDRGKCDKVFKECLKDTCHHEAIYKLNRQELEDCTNVGDLMYAGATGLGCEAFKEAQRNACMCGGEKVSKREMAEMERKEQRDDEL